MCTGGPTNLQKLCLRYSTTASDTTLLLRDFNCPHTTWEYDRLVSLGRTSANFVDSHQCVLLTKSSAPTRLKTARTPPQISHRSEEPSAQHQRILEKLQQAIITLSKCVFISVPASATLAPPFVVQNASTGQTLQQLWTPLTRVICP